MITTNDIKVNFFKQLSKQYSSNELKELFSILSNNLAGLSKIDLLTNPHTALSESIIDRFTDAIERLKIFEPIQYIIGKTFFCDLPIKVNPYVLIPRPETEELVNFIIEDICNRFCNTLNFDEKIIDIGTGSGCIAIALKKKFPHSLVYATDISSESLKIANENAHINNTAVKFIKHNILCNDYVNKNLSDFSIIVSNPPYVRESEKILMLPNVLNYEPHLALFVNDDSPLIFYQAITAFALMHLNKNGAIYFEINENFANEVLILLNSKGFKNINLLKDINDKPRFVSAVKTF